MLASGKRMRGGFMQRCSSVFVFKSAIMFVLALALTGCLGKSSSTPDSSGVQTVTLTPTAYATIDVGAIKVFSASALDADGKPVPGVNIQFVVASGNPNSTAPLSITANGYACAGTWDSSSAICNPGTPGIALVHAVANGVSSTDTTVYVHQHIDSIQISNAEVQSPQYDCFSQGQAWHFQAKAYSGNPPVDITNSVGPITWSSSNFGVVTTTTYVPPSQPTMLNQMETTAKAPGITQLFASVAGTTSSPYPYTTCLIKSIHLQIGSQGSAGNSITVNNGISVSVTATAIDSLYNVVNFAPLPAPPLTWSTTNPEVAAFTTTTNITGTNTASSRSNLGGATLTASCIPPTCNIGILPGLPIYASNGTLPNGTPGYGSISVNVALTANTQPSAYTAWAATTGCNNQPGCTSALFSVTPTTTSGTNPIGSTILTLPRTPNSLMFNHASTQRLYIGSDQGLMYVDVTGTSLTVSAASNTSIPCNVAICGQLLNISNDGKLVVVSDTVSTPSQVYIYNGSNSSSTPVDLILSVPGEKATAAAFSPDQLKLFILTDAGNMYIYSTVDATSLVQLAAPATDVQFSADGSFAYVAGAPASSVSAYSTCSLPGTPSVDLGSVAASSTPLKIFPSPVLPLPFEQNGPPPFQQDSFFWTTQNIIALEPPNVEFLTAEFAQNPILYQTPLQLTCNPPLILPNGFTKGASFNLGQGNFTPIYSQLVADGTELLLVTKKIPAVLLFSVADGNTTSVPLANNADPLWASASSDGSQVFIAACDQYDQDGVTCAIGSIHIINTVTQGDYLQVPYVNNSNRNMCNNQGNPAPQCLPNLVAIKPQ
jgi:hypothetical protein